MRIAFLAAALTSVFGACAGSPADGEPLATQAPPAAAEPAPPTAAEPVSLAASVQPARVARGAETTLLVRFRTAPTWHVYGAAADGEMATRLALDDAPGVQAGPWAFPAAHPSPDGGPPVLEGDFTVRCPLRVAADARPGRHRLRVTVDYMACDPLRCNPPVQCVVEAELEVR